ncbi:hypothetical protein ACFL27_00615 [candidate division CSSED10-310 bacterium]|uniref:Carboxypeptidase regulatory-like domain-containing protein n=1 Tax=candidate division CSSED10-310 bacterium TaxID=2855610 RepID=A0ABV6YR44_UNCC1
MRPLFVIYLIIFFFVPGGFCFGHGLQHTEIQGGVGLAVLYDDGTPMSYCEVKVYSPADGETEFQQGLTDKNGRFLFYADVSGEWRITVDDGMGHLVQHQITVDPQLTVVPPAATGYSRRQGTIIGLSLIFGIFGLISMFTGLVKRK